MSTSSFSLRRESVWDYPRPPRLDPSSREVVVTSGGTGIARSRRAIRVLERSHPPAYYLPPDDVRTDLLVPDARRTVCEYKGEASYWSLSVGDRLLRRVAWSYEQPARGYEAIAGHLCFYPGRVACSVDGVAVEPQPGDFYGGWITPEIEGPFKGGPGTSGW